MSSLFVTSSSKHCHDNKITTSKQLTCICTWNRTFRKIHNTMGLIAMATLVNNAYKDILFSEYRVSRLKSLYYTLNYTICTAIWLPNIVQITYILTYTHARTHARTYTHTHTHLRTCSYIYTHTFTHTHIHTHMHIYAHAHTLFKQQTMINIFYKGVL